MRIASLGALPAGRRMAASEPVWPPVAGVRQRRRIASARTVRTGRLPGRAARQSARWPWVALRNLATASYPPRHAPMSIAQPASSAASSRALTVALIGNPNTGKSTLFNALAGLRQRVGNYPGVTVEKKVGQFADGPRRYELVDLPGTYSLAPRSPDEMVAVDVLLGRVSGTSLPDVVLCIVDASNLERNLYLVSQILELGRPTVVALNMMDLARQRGMTIDVARLQQRLGVPVVALEAHRKRGLAELKQALAEVAGQEVGLRPSPFPETFCREVERLSAELSARGSSAAGPQGAATSNNGRAGWPRYLVERLLLDVGGYLESRLLAQGDPLRDELRSIRASLQQDGCPVPAIEAVSRYQWIGQVLQGVISRPVATTATWSDRLDRVLTHRVWGSLVFVLMMAAMFCTIFVVADTPMGWIDAAMGTIGGWVQAALAGTALEGGPLESLLVNGVVGGVGAVVIFLPQILLLFLFIAIMEACGYMARAAFLMDKVMSRVGLSGKSFIPLLSSFACAVPGIMATRVIENRRDRLTTILVAPLMSCSARLPVYTILIAAFIPTDTPLGWALPGLVMLAMYCVGVVAAVAVAFVLKKTLLRGETPPFVMELPSYKIPMPQAVLYRMAERGWAFLKRAGTLIFAASIVIWALGYYPRGAAVVEEQLQPRLEALSALQQAVEGPAQAPRAALLLTGGDGSAAQVQGALLAHWQAVHREALQQQIEELRHDIAAEELRHSFLGRAGQWVEPVVRPLGWDWRIGCAAIASFPAREVVMSTLGVIYKLGDVEFDDEEGRQSLIARLQQATWDGTDRPVYSIPVALSLMVFFALCAQCVSTLAVMRRETNSWRWPAFAFTYMTLLAYLAAMATYQIGALCAGG
jgi:ferrous iron transport protein B